MLKFLARWFALKFLTTKELLDLGVLGDDLVAKDATDILNKLIDRHLNKSALSYREALLHKVLSYTIQRTVYTDTHNYLLDLVKSNASRYELVRAAAEIIAREELERDDSEFALSYPLVVQSLVEYTKSLTESNWVKFRALLAAKVKEEFPGITSNHTILMVSLIIEIKRLEVKGG